MSMIEKLRKRRSYPVTIGEETVHVRALTEGERTEVLPFKSEDSSFGFVIGCGLLNDAQEPEFVKAPGESPQDFGTRVLKEADLPTDTRTELATAILNLTSGPKREALVKN